MSEKPAKPAKPAAEQARRLAQAQDEAAQARSGRNLHARLLHPPRRGRMRSARKLAARGARTDGGVETIAQDSRVRIKLGGAASAAPESTSRNTRPAAGACLTASGHSATS